MRNVHSCEVDLPPADRSTRRHEKKRKLIEGSTTNNISEKIKRQKGDNNVKELAKHACTSSRENTKGKPQDLKTGSKDDIAKLRKKHKLSERKVNIESAAKKAKKTDANSCENKTPQSSKPEKRSSSSVTSEAGKITSHTSKTQPKSSHNGTSNVKQNKKDEILQNGHVNNKVSEKSHKSISKNSKSSEQTNKIIVKKDQKQQNTSHKKKDKTKVKNAVEDTKHSSSTSHADIVDPMALLMQMEGLAGKTITNNTHASDRPSTSAGIPSSSGFHMNYDFDQDISIVSDAESEEMSDWEEVHDHHMAHEKEEKSQLPDKPVEITLEMPDILKHKKRQKKKFDWKAYLARRMKRFKKEVAIDMHKVHLLCLLSLGLQQNKALNDPTLQAMAMSLLPAQFTAKSKLSEERKVENLLLWYKRQFSLENVTHCSNTRLVTATSLGTILSQGTITDARVWVLIFICVLRAVGLTVRLVLSFQPMPFKVDLDTSDKKGGSKAKVCAKNGQHKGKGGLSKSSVKKATSHKCTSSSKTSSKPKKSNSTTEKPPPPKRRLSERESSKKAVEKTKKTLKSLGNDLDDDDEDLDDDYSDGKNNDSASDVPETEKKKKITTNKRKKIAENESDSNISSSEGEFEESSFYFQSPGNLKKNLKISSNRKALSPETSDDEMASQLGPVGHDFWLEVYFTDKKKWVCFDCFKGQFGKPYSLENSATQPLAYVLGFKNDDSVKDVTARYARKWLSHTRKQRADEEWWTQTVFIFDNTPYKEILMEDDEIKGQLLTHPMPTSIAEFKNHPLYALRRHLLKFEAIYPDTAIPLGYIKKEPVYARECVRLLHSRDNWLKEGRLVRLDEQPYKMVKSRPKWNKPKDNPDELDLELYGEWQTEIYIPPPAVDGKVPRNEYGNVELFKPWMLPKGTVHIRGQNMQRIAKKLNIDIAQAMIGWDYHSGYSHPLMDGWVVCEEFADTLLAAWEEDQEIQLQREIEKREKRVYDNWRLLIRGLLIKDRLKNKFLQEPSKTEKVKKKDKFADCEEAGDVKQAWPQNRKEAIKSEKAKTARQKAERNVKVLKKESDPDSAADHDTSQLDQDEQTESTVKTEAATEENKIIPQTTSKQNKKSGKAKPATEKKTRTARTVNRGRRSKAETPDLATRQMASEDEEDPDFEMSGSQVKHSQNYNKRKSKEPETVTRQVEDELDGKVEAKKKNDSDKEDIGLDSSVRARMPRQAKKNLKLVVDNSDDDFEDVYDGDDDNDSDYVANEDEKDRDDEERDVSPPRSVALRRVSNTGGRESASGSQVEVEDISELKPTWRPVFPVAETLNLSEESDEEDDDTVMKEEDNSVALMTSNVNPPEEQPADGKTSTDEKVDVGKIDDKNENDENEEDQEEEKQAEVISELDNSRGEMEGNGDADNVVKKRSTRERRPRSRKSDQASRDREQECRTENEVKNQDQKKQKPSGTRSSARLAK